jgi:hypothetical protein
VIKVNHENQDIIQNFFDYTFKDTFINNHVLSDYSKMKLKVGIAKSLRLPHTRMLKMSHMPAYVMETHTHK